MQPTPPYPLDSNGWSVIPPSVHQWRVAPEGDDRTGDGSEAKPLRTTGMAMARARGGDDILWKCGGIYDAPGGLTLSNITCSSYGQGERPVLLTDTRYTSAILLRNCKQIRIIDLEIRPINRDPLQAGFDQTKIVGGKSGINADGVDGLLIEGCSITHFGVNIVAEGWLTPGLCVRRNFIGNAYAADGSQSHGMLTDRLLYPLIEENVFFQNGWHPLIPSAKPTQFCHTAYFDADDGATEVTFRRNLVFCNSTGVQLRPGGYCTGNYFQSNGIDVDAWAGGSGGELAYNVVSGNPDPGPWSGGGLMAQGFNPSLHHNLVVNSSPSQLGKALAVQWPDPNRPGQKQLPSRPPLGTRAVVVDNTIIGWGPENLYMSAVRSRNDIQRNLLAGATRKTINVPDGTTAIYVLADNTIGPSSEGIVWGGRTGKAADLFVFGTNNTAPAGPVPAPDVSIQAYATAMAGPARMQDFISLLQKNRRANWNRQLTAEALVNWARRQYDLPPLP